MSDHLALSLTTHLRPENATAAIRLLEAYYAGPLGGTTLFEGGWWDDFDPSHTRESSQDVFTADDLLSASLLSAPIEASAVLQIVHDKASQLSTALKALGEDRDLADLDAMETETLESSSAIWRELRSVPHIGPTRASKLIARKRPRLVPVYDEVVGNAVYGGTSVGQWTRLHTALTANDRHLAKHLVSLHQRASLPDYVSPLRVFDVLAWLDGSGRAELILSGELGASGRA